MCVSGLQMDHLWKRAAGWICVSSLDSCFITWLSLRIDRGWFLSWRLSKSALGGRHYKTGPTGCLSAAAATSLSAAAFREPFGLWTARSRSTTVTLNSSALDVWRPFRSLRKPVPPPTPPTLRPRDSVESFRYIEALNVVWESSVFIQVDIHHRKIFSFSLNIQGFCSPVHLGKGSFSKMKAPKGEESNI